MSFPSSGSAGALGLLAPLYAGAVALRGRLFDGGWLAARRLEVPVISVGNITAGGTGKSPMVRLIAGELARRGKRPAVISRGYGGRYAGPALVVSSGGGPLVSAATGGDEPVMLARQLASSGGGADGVPVVVARRRADGGALAIRRFGSLCLVLDDGYQHRSLARDLDLLLLDGADPFGNGRLLPAGPLREPVSAMRRAGAIIVTNAGRGGTGGADSDRAIERARAAHCPAAPLFHARSRPAGLVAPADPAPVPIERLRDAAVVCFAGIARPQRFFDDVAAAGARVAAAFPFPDHHRLGRAEIDGIGAAARAAHAALILTTEKDLARLDERERLVLGGGLHAMRTETTIDELSAFADLLGEAVP